MTDAYDRTAADPVATVDELLPGYESALWRKVVGEVRWSFTRPWIWLSGVAVNLVLSLVFLSVMPLTGRPHRDWAILVGSYFAVWILADVTSTNVLGADAVRVRVSLLKGISLLRILVVKNLALLIIVALPTLLATAIITINSESGYRMALTLPGVAFPILTWLGVGNLVSVAFPVATLPWRERWEQRRDLRRTARWAVHLSLPYALLLAVSHASDLPRMINRGLPMALHTAAGRGGVLVVVGLVLWGVGTAAALTVAHYRDIRL